MAYSSQRGQRKSLGVVERETFLPLWRFHPSCRALRTLFMSALLLATGFACGQGESEAGDGTLPRPHRPALREPDADLLALVPDGAQLLLLVDLETLRQVHGALVGSRRGQGSPSKDSGGTLPGAKHLPGALGGDVLGHASLLALALWLDDGPRGQVLLLARGPAKAGKTEPGKAETGKAETGKAEQGKAETGKAETGKAETGKAETGKAETGRAEPGRASGEPGPRPAKGTPAPRPVKDTPAPSKALGALVRESLLAKGAPGRDSEKLRAGAPGSKVQWERYRDVDLATYGAEATAIVTSRSVVSGPLPLVKHSVDLLREVPGFASIREDRAMMSLWRLVTGPTAGRAPALAGVARFPSPVRDRMSSRLGLKAPPHRGGVRISVGEWLTIRAFLDCPDSKSAHALIGGLERALQSAARSKLVTQLRLAPLLDLLAVHQESGRVHGQWHAPLPQVAPHLGRLVRLLENLREPRPAP